MTDNVAITAGTGTSVATDDIGGVQHQRVKISLGADGVAVDAVAGAGAVSTAVQRVTLASDDPGVAALEAIESAMADTAHDSADAGNPVKVGGKAVTALSGVTAVTANDRTNAYFDLDGVQIVRKGGCHGDYASGNASNTDGTSTECVAAGASGVKHYLTDVTLTNTSASNIYVELKDGSTVKWTCPVPANSGFTKSFQTPIAGTAATAWNFDPSAAASTIYCSMSVFKSKV